METLGGKSTTFFSCLISFAKPYFDVGSRYPVTGKLYTDYETGFILETVESFGVQA